MGQLLRFLFFWLVASLGGLALLDCYEILYYETQGQNVYSCKKSNQSAKALLRYEYFPIT